MKVEIGAKSAARTIKLLLRALKVADKELDHQEKTINILGADNEHMAREIERLEGEIKDSRTVCMDLQRKITALRDGVPVVVKESLPAPVTQSPSKPCPTCGATPWGQNKVCPSCQTVRYGP